MIKCGIIMDPISKIKINKDSSVSMLLEMQRRKYEIYYIEINKLYLLDNKAYAISRKFIEINKNIEKWYKLDKKKNISLKNLDLILIRKNPPFDLEYIYATYILEKTEKYGTLVLNKPKSLRNYNEKISTTKFNIFIPKTLISNNKDQFKEFHKKNKDIIIKPLNKMGGDSIFRIKKKDKNFNVIIETMTKYGKCFCMAQEYIPEIKYGDKRILVINGKPIPYCLARIPKKNETRGNLAKGGYGEVRCLTKNDLKIVKFLSPFFKKNGLMFVGLDVIGNKLIEINITSPTCIQEIENKFPELSIAKILFNEIEKKMKNKKLKKQKIQ